MSEWINSVINIEQQEFQKGEQDGRTAARENSTEYSVGFRSGFIKGYTWAFELTFMKAVCQNILTSLDSRQVSLEEFDSAHSRTYNRCLEIISLVDSLPQINMENVDFRGTQSAPPKFELVKQFGLLPPPLHLSVA